MKKIDALLIVALIILAITLRCFVLRNGAFPFWFDVARDAIVSREIPEKHHLKIQGPNASGTKDTVFHGVLYYYLIGPLYTLLHGDPQMVVYLLGALSALAIIPVYFLAFELGESRAAALLAGFLYICSYDAIRAGTWLSNPVIAAASIPFFMYFLWKTFWKKEKKYLPWLALALGISTQSVIFFVTLWGEVLLAAWFTRATFLTKKNWATAIGIYFVTIVTMILAELKMIRAGLLTLQTLAEFSVTPITGNAAVFGTLELIIKKLTQSILPTFPVAAVIIFLIAFLHLTQRKSRTELTFFSIVLTGPLWLIGWHFREMYHAFIGLEAAICILLALWLGRLAQSRIGQFFAASIVVLFLVSNFRMWRIEHDGLLTMYFLPQGAYLHDQLTMIDDTYRLSNHQPFSISSVTNPYGYNTTWAYLYSWYGKEKYGYVPSFFGPDQTGIFGGDVLIQAATPSAHHFAIFEPNDGIPEYLRVNFKNQQDHLTGTPSAYLSYGSINLEVHTSSTSASPPTPHPTH